MHQPMKWWVGLLPLALLWIFANIIKQEDIEADLTKRVKAGIETLVKDRPNPAQVTVGGRDVIFAGTAIAVQVEATTDAIFGVRKVIASVEADKRAPASKSAAATPQAQPSTANECNSRTALGSGQIRFEEGSARIASVSNNALDQLVALAKRCGNGAVGIEGHTDSIGNKVSNVSLSRARAEAAAEYLIRNGIDKGRILTNGYGDERPVASNDTAEGRAQNRRIEFVFKISGN